MSAVRASRDPAADVSTSDWRVFAGEELSPILRGALEMFHEHGYHGTSVRMIANRVGVTVPALYYHYENKQAMLAALLESGLRELVTRARQAVAESSEDPVERFANLVECLVLCMTHRLQWASLDSELRHLDSVNREHYAALRKEIETLFATILHTGTQRGIFDTAGVTDTARALLGMFQAIVTWYDPAGSVSPEKLAERYVGIAARCVGVSEQVLRWLDSRGGTRPDRTE